MKGLFIAFEGVNGSGKSTQVRRIFEKLNCQDGLRVASEKEPTDSRLGDLVKNIFLDGSHIEDKNDISIAGLFVVDRISHIMTEAVGLKALIDKGTIVLCDRYYFTSYAYQGLKIGMNRVVQYNSLCSDILRPDLTIFIDTPVEICEKRLNKTWKKGNNSLFFWLHDVRKRYLKAFRLLENREKVIVVNGKGSKEYVEAGIMEHIAPLIEQLGK